MSERILIFIDWYRPGYKAGGPITSVDNMVNRLKENFQFYIITRNTDHGDPVPYADIEPNRWIDRDQGVKVCYLSEGNTTRKIIYEKAMEAGCRTWYIVGVYSWFFSILPVLLSRRISVSRVIISTRGMFSPHAISQKSVKKNAFLLLAKLIKLYRGKTFHATSSEEENAIGNTLGPKVEIKVAPNLFSLPRDEGLSRPEKISGKISLIILSRISPEKNTLEALKIISEIPSGEVSLCLAGQISDAGYWDRCQEVITKMPDHIHVEFKGALSPSKIRELYGEKHFLFLPTTGENFGHAIIECLSSGIPAIISDRTPWSDIRDAGAGWNIPLEDITQFRNVIMDCLEMDQKKYEEVSNAARDYASLIHENPANLEANLNLFKK